LRLAVFTHFDGFSYFYFCWRLQMQLTWSIFGALNTFTRLTVLTIAGGMSAHAFAGGEVRSMPPAAVESTKAVNIERFLGSAVVAHRVTAEPWDASVVATSKATSATSSGSGERAKPLQIGYPRGIPALLRNVPLALLPWQTLADGSRVIRAEIRAVDAAALRVGYRVEGPTLGLQLRFAGNGRDEVYSSTALPDAELTWSPVLEGETATIELRLLPNFSTDQFRVTLERLSHLTSSPADWARKDVRQIGKSGACNFDIACVTNASAALLSAAKSTAKMVITVPDGRSSYCTGTLINSESGADYFFSASHCISDQATASSLSTYWFFDAVACNSIAPPPYQLVNGGANLVMTDPTLDVTLLRLREAPPLGAVRAAWNATVIGTAEPVYSIHHPEGDLKKFSRGSMLGYQPGPATDLGIPRIQFGKDSFITVQWDAGTTEGGSSGAGVFTLKPDCGNGRECYELRGGLWGGDASCANPNGADRFSRMDLLYTRLVPFLQPSATIPVTTSAQASMVEYFNPQSDFYFITSRENEKALLDGLIDPFRNQLWYRSGFWFKTDTAQTTFTAPLTRYQIPGAAKAGTRVTHFYSVLNSDRSAITSTGKERFANPSFGCQGVPNGFFCNEGTDSFIAPPITSTGTQPTCLNSEQPIYRVFRKDSARYFNDGNHRYLTTPSMFVYMVNDLGWANEGVAFCAKP
jgi:lysyl endopeptidase